MASKSKSRRRVFRASCILAALIVAGSSFAWFASKDEVANRLTATADYGTSIVEDFAPPKAMTPGENVNKDVSVVNTGSIDAFVRVALENQLEITTYGEQDLGFTVSGDKKEVNYNKIKKTTVSIESQGYANAGEAGAYINNNLTPVPGTTYTVITDPDEVGKFAVQKTEVEVLPDRYPDTTAGVAARDQQVTDLNTSFGGNGVTYAAADAQEVIETVFESSITAPTPAELAKGVKLSTGQSYNENTGKLTPNEVTTLQAGGTLVVAANQIIPASSQYVVAGDDTTPPAQIDYDGIGQYVPDGNNGANDGTEKVGLYIFKRTVYEGDDNDKTEYSGYYYDGTDFYALKTKVRETTTGSTATPYIDFGKTAGGEDQPGFTLNDDGEITAITGTISLLNKETYKTDGMDGVTAADRRAKVTVEFGELTEADNAADSWTASTGAPGDINAVKLTIKTETSRTDELDPSTASYDATANGTVIYVKLAEDWADHWDLVEPASAGTDTTLSIADWFYYKDTVKSGETTEKLVDYVRIDNTVNQTDFVDLVYDLNVVLESKQVVHNTEGDETAEAVPVGVISDAANWATPTLTDNPVDQNGDVTTITSIDWN